MSFDFFFGFGFGFPGTRFFLSLTNSDNAVFYFLGLILDNFMLLNCCNFGSYGWHFFYFFSTYKISIHELNFQEIIHLEDEFGFTVSYLNFVISANLNFE